MFTADVANLTASDAEFPQLLFKLYGYKTDNEGNVVKKNSYSRLLRVNLKAMEQRIWVCGIRFLPRPLYTKA